MKAAFDNFRRPKESFLTQSTKSLYRGVIIHEVEKNLRTIQVSFISKQRLRKFNLRRKRIKRTA